METALSAWVTEADHLEFSIYYERLCEAKTSSSWAEKVSRVDVLWDPGNQRLGLEDHLISVAALDGVAINQAADVQVVRIWRLEW